MPLCPHHRPVATHAPASGFRHAVLAAAMIAATIAAGCSGCSRGTSVLPGDIRSYTVSKQAEPAPIAASPGDVPTKPAPVRYDVPEGWTDGGASGIRLATLLIGDPAGQREVTIIPASGTLEGNVARWQGQLDAGGEPDDLASRAAAAIEAAESVDVDGRPAKVVLLRDAAAEQAILGAMIPGGGGASLFVKFKGDADVAARERERFVRFVSSIRWQQ